MATMLPNSLLEVRMTQGASVRARRGMSIIWMLVTMTVFIGFVSLAVDYGRVQMAKTEMRRAADAAARAGASGLGDITISTNLAIQYAAANKVDGTNCVITASDIDMGNWDDVMNVFTPWSGASRAYANAIRITAKRTSVANGAINLPFARFFGMAGCDVTAVSICAQSPCQYGMVGLDSISLAGNATSSYWSQGGGTGTNGGNIGSNGNITLGTSSYIRGNAHPGIGKTVSRPANVYGATTPLVTPLSYPNASIASPYSASNNDNGLISSNFNPSNKNFNGGNGNYTWPGGVYVINTFSLGSNGSLTLTGPVTIYCYGSFSLNGQAVTNATLPKNLNLIMIPNPSTGAAPGAISLGSGTSLYATIYAPQSALSVSGNGAFHGSIVAKSVNITGSGDIYYDASLGSNGGIALVK